MYHLNRWFIDLFEGGSAIYLVNFADTFSYCVVTIYYYLLFDIALKIIVLLLSILLFWLLGLTVNSIKISKCYHY